VLTGLLVSVLLAGAALALRRSTQPRPQLAATPRPRQASDPRQLAVGIVAGGLTMVITSWPVLAVVVGVLVARWQQLLGDDAATNDRARVAAIAKWLEDLRDLLRSSSAGAEEALDQAAARASTAIAVEMDAYRQHRRHGMRIDEAVATLGTDLHHPLSDAAVASIGLVLSGSVGSGRLFATVDALATAARSELAARERIDRTRATYGSTMKRLVVIGLALVVYLCIAGRDLVKPYGTVTGQVALCVPLAMWSGCVVWLRSLRRYGGAA
jgi:hypothetical protein